MTDADLDILLQQVYEDDQPTVEDLAALLAVEDEEQMQAIFTFADDVRRQHMGDGILLRGLVEFSSHCRNTCAYCGLNRNNTHVQRYRLSSDELLGCAALIASHGIKTIVLQSGEDNGLDANWLAEMITEVKARHDMAVTLCVGERSTEEYALWRQAGADRYLLKIETSDEELYGSLHPGMSFWNRLRCLDDLRMLGYQVGSGCLVGLKGQTLASLARDIVFFAERRLDMTGIGVFIPHAMTAMHDQPHGNVALTLKVVALTRIAVKDAHMPATTALGSISLEDARIAALQAGANVLMPNYTPLPYRRLYDIYPGKRCLAETCGCDSYSDSMMKTIGRAIDYSRGDSLRMPRTRTFSERVTAQIPKL